MNTTHGITMKDRDTLNTLNVDWQALETFAKCALTRNVEGQLVVRIAKSNTEESNAAYGRRVAQCFSHLIIDAEVEEVKDDNFGGPMFFAPSIHVSSEKEIVLTTTAPEIFKAWYTDKATIIRVGTKFFEDKLVVIDGFVRRIIGVVEFTAKGMVEFYFDDGPNHMTHYANELEYVMEDK